MMIPRRSAHAMGKPLCQLSPKSVRATSTTEQGLPRILYIYPGQTACPWHFASNVGTVYSFFLATRLFRPSHSPWYFAADFLGLVRVSFGPGPRLGFFRLLFPRHMLHYDVFLRTGLPCAPSRIDLSWMRASPSCSLLGLKLLLADRDSASSSSDRHTLTGLLIALASADSSAAVLPSPWIPADNQRRHGSPEYRHKNGRDFGRSQPLPITRPGS